MVMANETPGREKLDDSLVQQLDKAGEDEPVEAVFRLHATGAKLVPAADETMKLAAELIGRAESAVNAKAGRQHVFKHMGSFVVSAKPSIIRHLLAQPEIAKATANRQDDAQVATI
jgi:hypothetical protein